MDNRTKEGLKRALERWAVPMDGCLIWTGSAPKGRANRNHHPHVRIAGDMHYVRRLIWRRDHGPIPEGMCVKNACGQDCCVAPEHIRLVPIGNVPKSCRAPYRPKPEGLAPPERICVECGRPFTPDTGNRVLCSEERRVTRARRIDRDRKRRARAKERAGT